MPLRLLTLGLSLLVAACATAGPRVANNPCDDPAYRALKARPADSLSEREQKELRAGDAACGQVTAVLAANAGGEGRRPEAPRMDTDAYTQAMQQELGSEIFIRNNGNVAIIVTSLTLSACSGVRDFCGTQHPRVRIEPGDVRRVARVRFREAAVGSFQYSYQVEPADPTQS